MEYFLGYAPQTPNLISVSDLIWGEMGGWELRAILNCRELSNTDFLRKFSMKLGKLITGVNNEKNTLFLKLFFSQSDLWPLPHLYFMNEVRKCILFRWKKKNPISTPFLSTGLLDRFPDSEGFNWRLRAARGRFLFIQHWTAGNWAYQVWRKMKSMSKWTPCVLPQEGQIVLRNNHLVGNTC